MTTQGTHGNDIEDLPPREIAERALAATKGADSLRIKGKVTTASEQIRIDLALNSQGDCTGSIGQDGATAELIRADRVSYLKADEAFYRAADVDSETANQLADRWLKISDRIEGAGDLAEVCDLDNLLKGVPSRAAPGLTKGEVHEVNGKSAIPVTRREADVTVRMDVATEGEPYILKLTETGGEEPSDMTLNEYNKPVNAKAPDAEDVIDLERWEGP